MSKKVFWVILIPALLIIGGYVALQVFLRSGNKNTGSRQNVFAQSTSAQSGKAAKQSLMALPGKKEITEKLETDKRNGDNRANEAEDSLTKENTSPLDLRPLFIEKMQQLVKKSSQGLYNLSVSDLKIDVLASTVSLHGVRLRPDAEVLQKLTAAGVLPDNIITASFQTLFIDGINLDDAITSKTMDYRLVRLVNPQIELERIQTSNKKKEDFSESFLKEMDKLAIKKVEVEGGTITVKDKIKCSTKTLKQVQVQLKDILVNKATRKAKDRFLFAKDAQLAFHDFSMKSGDGLYDLKIGSVAVDAIQKQVALKNLTYGSELTKEAFTKKQKNAKSLYNLSLPSVTVNGVDWWPALNGEEINTGEITLKGGKLAVFLDRALPPENKMGSFANQMLAKLPVKVDINKLKIRDFDLSYEERNPRSEQSGTLYFDNTSIDITGINNSKSNKEPIVMNATSLFMKEVPMKTTLTFTMEKPEDGNFTAALELNGFEGSLVNSFAKPLGLMKVDRGEIKSLKATIKGDELAASGDVLVRYEKLKISLWKKKKGEEELKKKHLFSFLANVFAVKNSNPWWLDGQTRRKEPEFKRDPNDSFMALVWKTLFTGMLKTVGAPPKAAKGKK